MPIPLPLIGLIVRWLVMIGVAVLSWRVLNVADNKIEEQKTQADAKAAASQSILSDSSLTAEEKAQLIHAVDQLYEGGSGGSIGDTVQNAAIIGVGILAALALSRK